MNIKSLLLGSAAALVAVSGARAADAVVIAEPEPMEYVRICDTYGVGFYYIPGTETCLKLSGYIRYDIGVGRHGLQNVVDKEDSSTDDDFNDTYDKRARFTLRADARQETELGTLRGPALPRTTSTSAAAKNQRPSRTATALTVRPPRRHRHRPEPRLYRAWRLPHRQDQLAVHDLHRLFVRRHERRPRCLWSVRHAPDRLYLHRRQRLQRRGRSRRRRRQLGIRSRWF